MSTKEAPANFVAEIKANATGDRAVFLRIVARLVKARPDLKDQIQGLASRHGWSHESAVRNIQADLLKLLAPVR